ncbi:30S ribosomal protein [Dirofilaria immitis]
MLRSFRLSGFWTSKSRIDLIVTTRQKLPFYEIRMATSGQYDQIATKFVTEDKDCNDLMVLEEMVAM